MKERVGGHPHLNDAHSNFSGYPLQEVETQNPSFSADSHMWPAVGKGILHTAFGGQSSPSTKRVLGQKEEPLGLQCPFTLDSCEQAG